MTPSQVQVSKSVAKVQATLFMIANAMMVHEALAASGVIPGLQPLSSIDEKNPVSWLRQEWVKILNTNYEPIFKPALELLGSLPSHPGLAKILVEMAKIAQESVATMAVFKQDLAGRLYHTLLLKDIAKSLATYYTSIPAATLLARLAFNLINIDWSSLDGISGLVVADIACGSGTLLSASYTEIADRHVVASDQPDLSKLHKVLVEKVLWGFDVLDYAVHLASSVLVLRDPRVSITKTNTFVLPLGVVNNSVYLGSLDLHVSDDYIVFPLARTLYGALAQQPLQITVQEVKYTSLRMPRPSVIITNPPFARTGNVGKSVLFGYMPEAERKEVLEELQKLGEQLREKLNLSGSFGRAGMAAYFLLKSYIAVRDGGVLAFVLPRVFLSGSDWRPVREYLAKNGWLAYIVVSDDPSVSWAWSENTDLSEILMVYKKSRRDVNSRTLVAFIRRRPRSALEAKILADRIISVAQRLCNVTNVYSSTQSLKLGMNKEDIVAYVYAVDHGIIRDVSGINLNLAIGYHTSELSSTAYALYKSHKFLNVEIPLILLAKHIESKRGELDKCYESIEKSEEKKKGKKKKKRSFEDYIGYDVSAIRKSCLGKGSTPVGILMRIDMETFSSMRIDAKYLNTAKVPPECFCRAGRLHVPGVARFWLPTIGVIAAYTEESTLSQVTWTIPMSLEEAKIQALWLNTTPGIVHVLSLRQDSKGGFVQIKKASLQNLLLLDIGKLGDEMKESLLKLVDRFNNAKMPRFKQQFEEALNKQGTRYELDKEFLKIFGIDIEKDEAKWKKLEEIYKQLADETLFTYPTSRNNTSQEPLQVKS